MTLKQMAKTIYREGWSVSPGSKYWRRKREKGNLQSSWETLEKEGELGRGERYSMSSDSLTQDPMFPADAENGQYSEVLQIIL